MTEWSISFNVLYSLSDLVAGRSLECTNRSDFAIKEIIEGTGVSQGSLYRAIQKRTLETT